MIIQRKKDVTVVEWGNGTSHRFLLEADRMPFTVCHTLVRAGTSSRMKYRRHLEACYCIAGRGTVVAAEDGSVHDLSPGVLYALNAHDAHCLTAAPDCDLELISVFSPPLRGDERHALDGDKFSQY